ncbi:DUF3574 domain-containing protein [Amycolatopsis sp. cmx-11-32]
MSRGSAPSCTSARRPGGGELTDEVVTPRFPDGFTELTGRGQWRGSDG